MQILNATTQVKSVMTDRGDFITINPGEISRLIIASRNLIIGTMKLGTPSEIGIIISGSYEFDIAASITGSTPYIYSDLQEAKSKLLDPSIDYKANLNTAKVNHANEELIKQKDQRIEEYKKQIKDLESQIEDAKKTGEDNLVENQRKYKELEGRFVDVQKERDRIKSQLQEAQDQVSNLNENLNTVRKESSSNKNYYTKSQEMVDNLTSQLNAMTADRDKYKSEVEKIQGELDTLKSNQAQIVPPTESDEYKKLQSEYDNLKSNLKDASDTIENMKNKFNAACEKFRITTDENGEWIQLPADAE